MRESPGRQPGGYVPGSLRSVSRGFWSETAFLATPAESPVCP